MAGMLRKILLSVALLLLPAFGCAAAQQSSPNATDKAVPYKVGQWQPSDQKVLNQWVEGLVRETNAKGQPMLPVVQELKNLIESDPELLMLFMQMFEQVPSNTPEYQKDPTGQPQVRDYRLMLQLINRVMTKAPEFHQTGLVGFPINAIINWPMATPAGTTVFLNSKVNNQLKKILNQWGEFLKSKESRYVLNDNPETGWFGRDAKKAMPTFIEDFQCDPKQSYYGFTSWDDFFTRQFREGRRPVAAPIDNAVIANSCESAPYRLARGVKGSDTFWIKSQPYSLYHMLAGDPLIGQFEGGTIYQAFLSALSYHRWHSPVSGRIVKTQLIDGSYYAEALSVGFDSAGPNESQGYITHVASRALIFIEADNPDIGLMALLFVGMAEVSSNEITVSVGQHVSKGDQLGMFHFGGSTHCLIFRPQVKLEFDLRGQTPGLDSTNIPVRSKIATVMK